jgi:hypothetical protein
MAEDAESNLQEVLSDPRVKAAVVQDETSEAVAELREIYRLLRMFPFYQYKARNTLADQFTSQLKGWCQSQKLPDAGVGWRMQKSNFERLLRQIVQARKVSLVDEALDLRHVNRLHDKWLRVARDKNFDLGSRPESLFELNLAWALKFGGAVVQRRWKRAGPYQAA